MNDSNACMNKWMNDSNACMNKWMNDPNACMNKWMNDSNARMNKGMNWLNARTLLFFPGTFPRQVHRQWFHDAFLQKAPQQEVVPGGHRVCRPRASFLAPLGEVSLVAMVAMISWDSGCCYPISSIHLSRENNIDECNLDLCFASDFEILGKVVQHELKPGGINIPVDEANKEEYLKWVLKASLWLVQCVVINQWRPW